MEYSGISKLENKQDKTSEDLFNIGKHYYDENNYDKAIYYYKEAGKQGNANAFHNLGCMYEFGKGVKQNYDKAVKYYKLAIEKGNTISFYRIEDMYKEGKCSQEYFEKANEIYTTLLKKAESDMPNFIILEK